MSKPVPPHVHEAIVTMAKGFAPIVGLPWQMVAQHILDCPDRDQLLAEAIHLYRQDLATAPRH